MLLKVIFVVCLFKAIEGVHYNSYDGTPSTEEDIKYYEKAGNLMNCTNDLVLPCDPNERRRLDGTCNNLNNPTRGGYHTPLKRLLKAQFSQGDSEKLSRSGKKLVPERKARTHLVQTGKAKNPTYTQLLTHAATVPFIDTGSIHDSTNYLSQTTYCCNEEGKSDHMCTPTEIPADDPVFRFTGHRCMNLTRPKSFQSYGCIHNGSSALERMEFSTPTLDLSFIYYPMEPEQKIRTYSGGLLIVDIEDGTTWPPHEGPNKDRCLLNQPQLGETKCFGIATPSILPATLFTIWFHRLHNRIATELAVINPCWEDEMLFQTARDINIAIANEITLYELLPTLLGPKFIDQSLLRRPEETVFRNCYDENVTPSVYVEFAMQLRKMHLLQEGTMKIYDANYHYLKELPISNCSLRVGLLCIDNNMAGIARGAVLQACGANDYAIDPDIGTNGLGRLQLISDLAAQDLHKNRLFGIPPFADYIELFTGEPVTTWEHLSPFICWENIELLQEIYEDVSDVDFLAGLWVSRPIEGGIVSEIGARVLEEQFINTIKSDRHWYERENRPYAFTESQLLALRDASVASLLCEVGDISKVQSHAFLRISPENPLLSCDEIPRVNLNAWKDSTCQ